MRRWQAPFPAASRRQALPSSITTLPPPSGASSISWSSEDFRAIPAKVCRGFARQSAKRFCRELRENKEIEHFRDSKKNGNALTPLLLRAARPSYIAVSHQPELRLAATTDILCR